jgi:CheY-like chemotaxis protein
MEPKDNKLPANILLVDDDKIFGNIISKLLSKKYKITFAHDAETAMELIKDFQFNLILLDIHMGSGLNGFDVIKHIRKTICYKDTPVIVTTGLGTEHDEQDYIGKGFTRLLPKPFSMQNLVGMIDELLEEK